MAAQRLIRDVPGVDGHLIAVEDEGLPHLAGVEDGLAPAAADGLELLQRVGALQ